MRKPQRTKGQPKARVNSATTLPAPVKGWYVGDNITAAPKGTAYILDNCYCQYDYVRARRGALAWATGMGSSAKVQTLMPYVAGTTQRLFAVTDGGKIYDATAAGAVGAAAVTGLTSARMQYIQFTTTGGQFLLWANGADAMQTYDGAAWAASTITGIGTSSISNLWAFKSRIFMIEKNTLNSWYLAVDSIGGAATKLSLGGVFRLGGSLLCGATWAINSTSGLYETCVFITDLGEIAFYDGDGPAAANWTLKGTYKIGRPLGPNCLVKAGGDLAVMTEQGIIPLSKVMQLDELALQGVAVTKPIAPAWRNVVQQRPGYLGWSITLWPRETMAIVNIPQTSTSDKQQFIANAESGAWSRYTGWDALSFAVLGDNLFYGTSDGRVMQAETGGQDGTGIYTAICCWSFSDLGAPGKRKSVRLMRPILQTSFVSDPAFSILADYDFTLPAAPSVGSSIPSTFRWDIDKWDVGAWGGVAQRLAKWATLTGIGTAIAPVMQYSISTTDTPDIRVTQLDLVYEAGEVMG